MAEVQTEWDQAQLYFKLKACRNLGGSVLVGKSYSNSNLDSLSGLFAGLVMTVKFIFVRTWVIKYMTEYVCTTITSSSLTILVEISSIPFSKT
jgi:hypothetical protein